MQEEATINTWTAEQGPQRSQCVNNVAYGQVKYAPNTYEELDRLAAAASGGGAPVYATADETTTTPTGK